MREWGMEMWDVLEAETEYKQKMGERQRDEWGKCVNIKAKQKGREKRRVKEVESLIWGPGLPTSQCQEKLWNSEWPGDADGEEMPVKAPRLVAGTLAAVTSAVSSRLAPMILNTLWLADGVFKSVLLTNEKKLSLTIPSTRMHPFAWMCPVINQPFSLFIVLDDSCFRNSTSAKGVWKFRFLLVHLCSLCSTGVNHFRKYGSSCSRISDGCRNHAGESSPDS